jgi:adenosylmethionine-8-amino-7-oxononanoate aminotransferase
LPPQGVIWHEFLHAIQVSIIEASIELSNHNLGSDATETAVKLAIQYHNLRGEEGRKYFISRKQSYHGSTIFSLSLSGHKQRRETYKPILYKKVSFVSACNEYRGRGDKSVEEYVKHLANELNDEIERVGPDRVAAFIVEPVVGAVSVSRAVLSSAKDFVQNVFWHSR